jgi:sec-independent protein translocase protein TatA
MLRGIGAPELIIILIIVVLVFGVGRLGEAGAALGKGIREFRKATAGMDEETPAAVKPVEAPVYDLKVALDNENYDIKVKLVDDASYDKRVKVVSDGTAEKRVKVVDDASFGWKVKVINPDALK